MIMVNISLLTLKPTKLVNVPKQNLVKKINFKELKINTIDLKNKNQKLFIENQTPLDIKTEDIINTKYLKIRECLIETSRKMLGETTVDLNNNYYCEISIIDNHKSLKKKTMNIKNKLKKSKKFK